MWWAVSSKPGRTTPGNWGQSCAARSDPTGTPQEASPGSFGHVGSSGCLAWYDPAAGLSWAVLGTRAFQGWWKQSSPIGKIIFRTAHEPEGQEQPVQIKAE